MYERETTLKISVDKSYPEDYLKRIGREIVNVIRDRTAKSLDKNRNPFPAYSKEYKASDDFKLAGKTSRVDLTLSGDMLADLGVLSVKKGQIEIGFERGEQRAKAHGHITGANGNLPVRNFLGISEDELGSILRRVPPPALLAAAREKAMKDLGMKKIDAETIFGIINKQIELEVSKSKIIDPNPDVPTVLEEESPQ